mgnify:CR=1 FL=1
MAQTGDLGRRAGTRCPVCILPAGRIKIRRAWAARTGSSTSKPPPPSSNTSEDDGKTPKKRGSPEIALHVRVRNFRGTSRRKARNKNSGCCGAHMCSHGPCCECIAQTGPSCSTQGSTCASHLLMILIFNPFPLSSLPLRTIFPF